MAAWIPKSAIRVTKSHNVCIASYAGQQVQACDYSTKPRIIKKPTTASLKRGTGGRSSFNGITCTVFGNTGFLGRYLCNRLGRIGTQMILPYRGDHYNSMRLKLYGDLGQILFHPFDLKDEESIVRCVKYSDVVINLIGREYETRNFDFNDVHVEGSRMLARLSKECNVERFIHVSCLNASAHPKPMMIKTGSQCLKSKHFGECAVREEFPEATIVRPSIMYGQEDRFMNVYMNYWRRHLRLIPLWMEGKETEKQPVYVDDVAAGISAIVNDPRTAGKTYQFVGPKRYTLEKIVHWFYDLSANDRSEYGFRVFDIRYLPLFQMKVTMNELFSTAAPFASMHWEALEMHHTSDNVQKGFPTLEDVGVIPCAMESRMPWEIRPLKKDRSYIESVGEYVLPPPPETVPLKN